MSSAEVHAGPETLVRDYLSAFEARDVDGCTALYADDGVVQFQFSRYDGREAIKTWHRERFDANLRVVRVDEVAVDEGEVTVDALVASDRLQKWNFDSLGVRLTFALDGRRIRELRCNVRVTPW
jgi:hypothetical protein